MCLSIRKFVFLRFGRVHGLVSASVLKCDFNFAECADVCRLESGLEALISADADISTLGEFFVC